jgi:hypothetical protein
LECGSHGSRGLARGVIAGGDFAARLIELRFHLIGQFKLVFQKVINPRPDFLDLGAGQPGNRRFNFLNRTHGGKIPNAGSFAKPLFLIQRQDAAPQSEARQGWHICSYAAMKPPKLRRSGITGEYFAPTELGILCGRIFYKYVAPLALEGSAGFSPLQRSMDDDVWISGDAADSRMVKRCERRAPGRVAPGRTP